MDIQVKLQVMTINIHLVLVSKQLNHYKLISLGKRQTAHHELKIGRITKFHKRKSQQSKQLSFQEESNLIFKKCNPLI